MSDKKKVILTVGNCRIKEYDSMNVTVERYEPVYNPINKKTTDKWRFKGYSPTIFKALLFIQREELLIDRNSISGLNDHLKLVRDSNAKLLDVIQE